MSLTLEQQVAQFQADIAIVHAFVTNDANTPVHSGGNEIPSLAAVVENATNTIKAIMENAYNPVSRSYDVDAQTSVDIAHNLNTTYFMFQAIDSTGTTQTAVVSNLTVNGFTLTFGASFTGTITMFFHRSVSNLTWDRSTDGCCGGHQ